MFLGAHIFDARVCILLGTCLCHILFMETVFSSLPNSSSSNHPWNDIRKIPSLLVKESSDGVWQSKLHRGAGIKFHQDYLFIHCREENHRQVFSNIGQNNKIGNQAGYSQRSCCWEYRAFFCNMGFPCLVWKSFGHVQRRKWREDLCCWHFLHIEWTVSGFLAS